ncbi:MAG: EAL domain-containing protein [Pseudomonadota bacterium]
MDLDDFKRVNDTLGHEAGDALLEVLARRLRDTLAAHSFPDLGFEGHAFPPVARWGGDEFSVLLKGVDNARAAARVAAQILDALRQPVSIGGMDIVSGASIGIALYPADSEDLSGLLSLADVAMYHAKENSTERIAAYDASMRSSGENRLLLETDLRFAIEREQMHLDFEPVYDPNSEVLTALVTHLRWQHPEHGTLGPEAFMPLAESADQAAMLQCWTISRALAEFAACASVADTDVELIVSLMSDRIDAERLTEALADALERDRLDSARVVLQVDEPRLFRNLMQAVPLLEAVRMLGVQTWVDRFGSGHAAISRLRRLPLDGMSLDATLVKEVDESPADQSLAAAIIALAHSLGMRVSANGVVSRRQLDFLRRTGCDGVRGAFVGRAGPIAEVTRRLDPAEKNLA